MKRSGLQKNIAFIFDGTEPAADTLQAPPTLAAVQVPEQAPVATDQVANHGLYTPAISQTTARRPLPIPKKQNSAESMNLHKMVEYAKARLGTKKSNPSKKSQKKSGILVAVLAAVFIGILFFVFGSSPSQVAAAAKSEQPVVAAEKTEVNVWKKTDIYPSALRDPMKWPPHKTQNNPNVDSTLVVRGIVYSQSKPTAIISGKIVCQGEVISDVKVVKIAKDYVEFEKDNEQWKQQVEK